MYYRQQEKQTSNRQDSPCFLSDAVKLAKLPSDCCDGDSSGNHRDFKHLGLRGTNRSGAYRAYLALEITRNYLYSR